jgi:hypothetical protein
VSTPVYRFSRAIAFEARLSDPQTSRKFWVGGGQTNSGGGGLIGAISTSNGVNASSKASTQLRSIDHAVRGAIRDQTHMPAELYMKRGASR